MLAEMPLQEKLRWKRPPPSPPPILSQRRAQDTACDRGSALENVCLTLLERKIKGAFTSQTARGPSDVGSHHRRENSRRAVFASGVTETGL